MMVLKNVGVILRAYRIERDRLQLQGRAEE
jgi:hypothetical protein